MLETVLTAAITALCCSLGAHFVLHWETRVRLRRVEREQEDTNARVQVEQKRRAAQVSADVRSNRGLHPADEAAIARITKSSNPTPEDFPAWFDSIARK